jgi:hypothetical protein
VPGKKDNFVGQLGTLKRNVGGPTQPLVARQRGLHPPATNIFKSSTNLRTPLNVGSRHVCQPGKFPIKKVHSEVAALAGPGVQCIGLGFNPNKELLRKPPMDHHSPLAAETSTKSPPQMFNGGALLGWQCMVAPTSKAALQVDPDNKNSPPVGTISELPRGGHAPHPLAPSLFDVVRTVLERKQISPEGVTLYLRKISHLKQYDKAFKKLWTMLFHKGLDPANAALEDISASLLELNELSQTDARNAYAACLIIPGLEHLRFSPLLRHLKRLWNCSTPKYTDFWDATRVLDLLCAKKIDFSSIQQVRDRLIIVMRILHLMRSIDLARSYRVLSFQDGKPYWLLRRKGGIKVAWEGVLNLSGQTDAALRLPPLGGPAAFAHGFCFVYMCI